MILLDSRAAWLSGRDFNRTSQFGEDGLIAATLEAIGETNRWCFEVGAGDGYALSNTWSLRQRGWSAALIEANETHWPALDTHASPIVHCIHERIAGDAIDRILASVEAPLGLDFGSIDIDGQDYWVWKAMTRYEPRVMLVEFANPADGSTPEFIVPEGEVSSRQSGSTAIIELGKAKGYDCLATTHVNALFLRSDQWPTRD